MIIITDKHKCCGCSACVQACPKQCISFDADEQGFRYPLVDKSKCIDCGICEKVCPCQNPEQQSAPIKVIAAINNDERIRLNSSSGGIFHLLAEKTIAAGGVVFGARFDEQWQVVIDYAETMETIKAFMGSKYVQARIETAYTDASRFLQDGRKVLFSGTPCQIAGLYHFLGKSYDNLLTVDMICHGTPSPKVWSKYLDEVVTAGRKAISNIEFRNKREGWKRFHFTMWYNKDEQSVSLHCHHQENHFMRAFLHNLTLRPSCYFCPAKNGRSHSDITIGDFWGIDSEIPEMDDDKGTGLVIINTGKGDVAIDRSKITERETTAETALRHNSAYYRSVKPHPKNEEFMARLDECDSVISLISESLRPVPKGLTKRSYAFIKQLINNVLNFIWGGGG